MTGPDDLGGPAGGDHPAVQRVRHFGQSVSVGAGSPACAGTIIPFDIAPLVAILRGLEKVQLFRVFFVDQGLAGFKLHATRRKDLSAGWRSGGAGA